MAKDKNFKKKDLNEPKINDEIYGYENVRLIYKHDINNSSDKDINKVMSLKDAKKLSLEMELDLIEINGKTNPPIVRLANYSKYMYELKKQQKQKSKTPPSLKEVQLTTNISKHDLEIKANKARDFIKDGHKVKVVLTMRGRELTRKEESKKSIYEFITMLEDVSVPESMPRDENNKSIVILKKK